MKLNSKTQQVYDFLKAYKAIDDVVFHYTTQYLGIEVNGVNVINLNYRTKESSQISIGLNTSCIDQEYHNYLTKDSKDYTHRRKRDREYIMTDANKCCMLCQDIISKELLRKVANNQ